jgi:tRNA nucleotidyltransferase/poly(A) polymerase
MRQRIRQAIREHPLIPPILEEAASRNEPVFLVGGVLRDLALGLEPKDLDFATARPYEMARHFARRYGSKVVSLGKDATPTYRIPLEGLRMDWVGLHDGSLEADLLRRDFTIDALGYDAEEDRIHDPTEGIKDLQHRSIRMAYPGAFTDDPLRILKAYRLLAQLPGFRLDPGTLLAIQAQAPALLDVAPDRLEVELDRLLRSPSPGRAVSDMAGSGILFILMPELRALKGLDQNDYHHTDVLTHSLEALAFFDEPQRIPKEMKLPALTGDQLLLLRLTALFHDAGKWATRTAGEDGAVHFYGHPKPSADTALEVLKRLRFPNSVAAAVSELCLNHLRPLALIKTAPRKTAIRRLIHSMGDLLPLLLAFAYADKSAARGKDMEENLAALKHLSREVMETAASEGPELRHLPKLVDGLAAMAILGLKKPGPELGRALDALLERQVEGTITERPAAEAFLRAWASKNLK